MTEVYLHGILAKKYGSKHYIAISQPKDLLRAMEANHDDFLIDLKNLYTKNIHYTYIVNGKWAKNGEFNKEKIKRLDFVPMILGSGFFGLVMLAISVVSAVFTYMQAGKVEYPRLPGASATSSAFNKSLAFSNRENVMEQGNPVPLVYGRLRIGSFVIQSSIKSFPLSLSLTDELMNSSSKKGNNQVASIDQAELKKY